MSPSLSTWISLRRVREKARTEALTLRGRPVYKSELHQMLRKRVYTGDFDWDGKSYQGTHEPIVTRDVWEKVQGVLSHRAESKQHRIKHDFAFTGFITCGHCGCQLVGELKKGRYVYYHCTGHRGKCPEPYTREQIMAEQFASSLRDSVIPREALTWLTDVVSASDMNERAAREKAVNKLEEQHRRVQAKLDVMYEDRLEGRITADFYDRKARELQSQANALLRKVNEIGAAIPAPVEDAINLMGLTSRTADLFMAQAVPEQQRFLCLILKSASWKAGELRTEFEEPFETLRRSNRLTQTNHKENRMGTPGIENWLPGMDSNHN